MLPSLSITTTRLDVVNDSDKIFDMTGRCAFAICTEGEFKIRILNEVYEVTENCIFACMPFVNIEVISVEKSSEVIFGYIMIEDVPGLINNWINFENISVIQQHPVANMEIGQFRRIISLIEDYIKEYEKCGRINAEHISDRIQHDILYYQCIMIIGYVLQAFFAQIPLKLTGHTYRDEVFQRFMLSLYSNFREQRNVNFYAGNSGVSTKYFSTLVKRVSGKTPLEWIETVVTGEAKAMLKDPGKSIKDIASSLNFPDTPTFTKYFRRVEGVTPKTYRKSISEYI